MGSQMEFWGIEVKSNETAVVKLDADTVIHLSQACLGEVKKDKGNESIYLYVKFGGKKLVLGRLSGEKFPQIPFDLVFEKEFELSHNWKNGSVHFCGYKSYLPMGSDDSDLEAYPGQEELPLVSGGNGKPESQAKPVAEKANASKPDSTAQKVKIVEPKKEDESTSDDDDDDSDEDDSDTEEDQVMVNGGGESDEEDESDDDEDEDESEDDESSDEEETPKKKVEQSKKRPSESASKTPAPEKKAKFVTPQKTDSKKGAVHVATPHPAKQASKAAASNEQAKQQTPSSSGAFACKTCNRSFKSDQALQSHSKAKHTAAA